ncbi:MAG: cytochrome c [Pseudomonadota bacterium]
MSAHAKKTVSRPHRAATACLAAALVASVAAPAALAQDFGNQIKARQGLMRVQAANLGVLAAMVRGNAPYDAETARVAAANLAATGTIDQRFFWPEGSALTDAENTRALPEIWEDYADFVAEKEKFTAATVALQAAADSGLDALGPALRGVGQSCGSCHEKYQQSR